MEIDSNLPSVLVIGDDTRSFLSIVRSFGRRKFQVDVCPFDFSSSALNSRYIRTIFRIPPYNVDQNRWIAEVSNVLRHHHYKLIIPCDDRSILPIHRHRAHFGDVPFALPNEEAFRIFYDKHLTRELAQACSVQVAPGRLLTANDTPGGLEAEFGLPLVIKPRSSYELGNLGQRNKVRVIQTAGQLARELADEAKPDRCLVEGAVPGHGIGVATLSDHGQLVQAFAYSRVHEPVGGGGSSYRVSQPLDPNLLGGIRRMIEKSELDGVAMFEFRYDPASKAIHLLEVNGRFWGGLPLAIAAGIDFPWLLYQQSVAGEKIASSSYRINHFSRALDLDFYTIVEHASRLALRSRLQVAGFLLRTIGAGLWRMAVRRENIDTFSWFDSAPFRSECKKLASAIWKKVYDRWPLGRRWHNASKKAKIARILQCTGENRIRILFLCYGNICRSPFAEHYLRNRASDAFEIGSTGIHQIENRPSPVDAIAAAKAWNVDLQTHRSTFVESFEDWEASLIFVFDRKNISGLKKCGYLTGIPVFELEVLTGDGKRDIADPYGHGAEAFQECYARVAVAIDELIRLQRVRSQAI